LLCKLTKDDTESEQIIVLNGLTSTMYC